MRTQIRALNKVTEMKIGDNGNGHITHIQNIDYLADFYSRLGQKTVHVEVTFPENAKRPASAPTVFVKSPWITTGVLKVNMPGNRPAFASNLFARRGGFDGSNAVFLRSPWITSYGVFPVEKMNHSIENSLRLVAVLVSVNQDRTSLAHLRAA
ncbi:MAG: hypothetical protein NT178_12315 [Proteobacteria bacterium]|nr:hypothetical protein [Pseudomonadota bacterium]